MGPVQFIFINISDKLERNIIEESSSIKDQAVKSKVLS